MEQTNKNTGHAAPAACCSHHFPSIGTETCTSKRADDCFRPLFQAGLGGSDASPNAQSCTTENGNDPLAAALKESYDRGVAAGNKEACGLALKDLEPSLDRFLTAIGAFSDNMGHLADEYVRHVVELAISIAGKIVKERPQFAADEMGPVQRELEASLLRHHQLNLQLNSADLKELADLMRCRNVELNPTGAIHICDSGLVQRGVPRFSKSTVGFQELHDGILNAFESLAQASSSIKASTS